MVVVMVTVLLLLVMPLPPAAPLASPSVLDAAQ